MNIEARVEELKTKLDSLADKPFIVLLISEQPSQDNSEESVLGADLISSVDEAMTKQTLKNFIEEIK